MSDHQGFENDEDLLQSALSTAFSPPPSRRTSVVPTIPPPVSATPSSESPQPPAPSAISTESAPSREEEETWKEEYDVQLETWRAEAAVARRKAEEERARWEAIRAAEKESGSNSAHLGRTASSDEWERLEGGKSMPGPPNPSYVHTQTSGSPSTADARDQVTGEPRGGHGAEILEAVLPTPQGAAKPNTMEDSRHSSSHKWEEVPSMESSFPSLSFPEQSDTPSPEPQPRNTQPAVPPSVTLSVFDTSLTTRSRALALLSSITINLFLPFVNGVMLGFGEIFAKTLVGRLGWQVPGGVATAVGVGAVPRSKRL